MMNLLSTIFPTLGLINLWSGLSLDRARLPLWHAFFAAGHGEFAVSVLGGYTDIFKEKKIVTLCCFISFSLTYTIFTTSFSRFLYLYFSFFPVLVWKSWIIPKEGNSYEIPRHAKISPGTLKFAGACPMGTVRSNPKKSPACQPPLSISQCFYFPNETYSVTHKFTFLQNWLKSKCCRPSLDTGFFTSTARFQTENGHRLGLFWSLH